MHILFVQVNFVMRDLCDDRIVRRAATFTKKTFRRKKSSAASLPRVALVKRFRPRLHFAPAPPVS